MSTNASMINAWQAAQQPFAHAYGQHVQQQHQQQQQQYRPRDSYESVQSVHRPPVYPDQRQYQQQQQQQQQQQAYSNQYETPQGQQGYGQQYNQGGWTAARGTR
jgi:hypothetical protein